jgi:hypothetical protein
MLAVGAPPASAQECNIKGNVSTRGERIYHVPGQKYYDETRISRSHAERWVAPRKKLGPLAGVVLGFDLRRAISCLLVPLPIPDRDERACDHSNGGVDLSGSFSLPSG